MKGTRGVLHYLRGLDTLSRIALIVLVGTLTYVLLLFLLKPFFIPTGSMMGHTTIMGDHMMSFTSPEQTNLNIAALVGGVVAAAITAFLLGKRETVPQHAPAVDELTILKKALSSDEKMLVSVIEEAGEITQDSLVFRLGWNRSKVSVMVSHLEKMNILQRRREGKTYVVFLSKK